MPPALVADPTTGEWIAGWIALGLVALVLALHLLRPGLRRAAAGRWGRFGGLLLGLLAAGLVVLVAVALTAAAVGGHADDTPDGAFVGVLVHPEPATAGRLGGYVAAVLLPLAAVLGVLAAAVVDAVSSGLRVAAAAAGVVVLLVGAALVSGDTGPAVRGVGWASVVLGAGAAVAIVFDHLEARRQT